MEDVQVRNLLLLSFRVNLLVELIEAFLEVRSSVFLQLVVDLPGTSSKNHWRLFPLGHIVLLVYIQGVDDIEAVVYKPGSILGLRFLGRTG